MFYYLFIYLFTVGLLKKPIGSPRLKNNRFYKQKYKYIKANYCGLTDVSEFETIIRLTDIGEFENIFKVIVFQTRLFGKNRTCTF